jgi:cytochrome c oxidase subunit 6b
MFNNLIIYIPFSVSIFKDIIGTTADELKEAQENGTSDSDSSLLSTAPFDARFPNTNQTRACWQNYVDFNKCARAKVDEGGAEHAGCKKLQRLARIMCPASWIEKWDSALEEGINPSNMDPPKLTE